MNKITKSKQRIDIGSDYSGITIEYIKSTKTLKIHGHYDSFVGIEGTQMELGEFLRTLGISAYDCKKSLDGKIIMETP